MRIRTASRLAAAPPAAHPSRKPVALAVALALAAPHAALAAPTGATVVAGQVQLLQPDARTMLVKQGSDKAIINWRGFSIGAGERVEFQQPNSSSVALNRVISSAPSEIFGRLSANGKVFLVNPNGVMFGKGASVDVGALVASTLNIADGDFLGGRYAFADGGGAGAVRNEGSIAAAERGAVALLGAQVSNNGTISARLGTVGLAAGGKVSLDFGGDGLTRIVVDAAHINALVENGGAAIADGGQVTMTARALNGLAATVVRQTGVVQAHTLVERNGRIMLDGGSAGKVELAGSADASGLGAGRRGGEVTLIGRDISLADRAAIDVRGDAGGGSVLVGGGYRGANPLVPHAASTSMAAGATIRADAVASGNGGTVVLWSDGHTSALGSLSAKGGAAGGDGGLVETSGKTVAVAGMRVDASSPRGKPGTWLLDPVDVIIDAPLAATISAALNTGTSHEESTSNDQFGDRGDIHVNADILKSAGGDAKLTLSSDRDIIVAPDVRIASTAGKLDVDFNANYHTTPNFQVNSGGISMNRGSAILTNGGAIQFYGRSDPRAYAAADSVLRDGITLNGATLDTRVGQADSGGGGNVTLRGAGQFGDGDPEANGGRGIAVIDSSLITASGNITMEALGGQGALPGSVTSGPAGVGGIGIQILLTGTAKLSTTSGSISLSAIDGSGWHDPATNAHSLGSRGVQVDLGGQAAITATDGAISITGSSYGASGSGVAITMAGNATISAGGLLNIRGTASEDAGAGLAITGAAQGNTVGGGSIELDGIGARSAGLVLQDFNARTVAGPGPGLGRIVLAAETAADVPALSLDHVSVGAPGMLGDVLIRARNATGSSPTISYGGGAQIQTEGIVNIRPGGVDPDAVADRLIPIDVGAGSNQFQVALGSLGLTGAAGARIVIGSAAHTGAINYAESAAIGGNLTLQNDGAGSNGITINSNMNVNGLVTLSSGGEVRAPAAAINAASLLLHGSQAESNFQLTNSANSVARFAAMFDTPKGLASPAYGDVNFVNSGALAIETLTGALGVQGAGAPGSVTANTTVVAGDLVVRTGGRLTLGHSVATLGSDITLVTGGTFQNPSNSLLQPGGGGTWRVFADTWAGEARGGLAPSLPHPNNYNCGYGAPCADAIAGNRFVYRAQPQLTLQADSLGRAYGDANPVLTFSQSGLVNGDTLADVVTGAYATTATAAAPIGAYPIGGSFTSPVGYLIDAGPATLTVNRAALLISIDDKNKVYGDAEPLLTASASGFKNADTSSVISGLTLSTATGAAATAGTHAIDGANASAANYSISYRPGTLTVGKAPLLIVADDKAKVYGAADPLLTATMSGFRYADSSAVVSGLTLSAPAGPAAGAGTHPIAAANASALNYAPAYIGGVLAVAPAVLSYVASPAIQFQGEAPRPLGGAVTGFAYADTQASAATGTLAFTSAATPASPAGIYAVQGAGLAAANYRFIQAASNRGALSIVPAPMAQRPIIAGHMTFESSNVYEKNFGTPRLCVGTGPLDTGSVGADGNDLLALEWSRVRLSPNLSNCLGLGQRNSCSDF